MTSHWTFDPNNGEITNEYGDVLAVVPHGIASDHRDRENGKRIARVPEMEAACLMALEWINNLVAAHGQEIVINSMPNDCGGRNQLLRAVGKEPNL